MRSIRIYTVLGAIGLSLAGGCGGDVPVSSEFPSPLVEQLPLRVGVYYSDDFRSFTHADRPIESARLSIDIGSANVAMFERVLDSVFDQVIEIDGLAPGPGIDALVYPVVEEVAFLTPRESGSDFYSVSIRYLIHLHNAQGDRLSSWEVNSYGKARAKGGAKTALANAAIVALRDAAAALSVGFKERPKIVGLLPDEGKEVETTSN